MIKNKSFLFLQKDFKTSYWSSFILANNNPCFINKSIYPYSILIFFLQLYRTPKHERITVFRYLNDRRSFFKSYVNLIVDITLILLTKIFGGKVYRIKHNVDKETFVYYKKINKLREYIVSKYSNKIFVTDINLIKYLNDKEQKKADWICFGSVEFKTNKKIEDQIRVRIKDFKSKFNNQEDLVTGLTISSGLPKFLHFRNIPKIMNELNKNDNDKFIFILIGTLPFKIKDELLEIYNNNKYILYIENEEKINIKSFVDLFEYSYRSLNDMSVSFSIYDLVQIKKPIVTSKNGFLSEFIDYYNLGFTLENYDPKLFREKLNKFDKNSFKEFAMKFDWEKGANQLLK